MNDESRDTALVDLLDMALNKGVILWGDAIVSLADVDLAYVGIKLLLSSVEGANRMRAEAGLPPLPPTSSTVGAVSTHAGTTAALVPLRQLPQSTPARNTSLLPAGGPSSALIVPSAPPAPIAPEQVERGLAQLTLTVVELLRQLMERQALRRVEGGTLSDDAVERLGTTLEGLELRMRELKDIFGLDDSDLNLNLGPLGNLL